MRAFGEVFSFGTQFDFLRLRAYVGWMRSFGAVWIVLVSVAFVSSVAIASQAPPSSSSEVEAIFVRVKGGTALYSNVDPVAYASFALGVDLGFRTASGFGVAAAAKRNFLGSGTAELSTSRSVRTEVTSLFLGIIPSFSVTKGLATLTFGLGAGVLAVTTQVDTFDSSAPTLSTPEITRSRFAVTPSIDTDFDIFEGMLASVSVRYVVGLGESPAPSFFSPMAGIGYRF